MLLMQCVPSKSLSSAGYKASVDGGVGWAASVDYAIAAETAAIKLSELAVGIGPFVVGPAVKKSWMWQPFSQLAIDAPVHGEGLNGQRKGLFAEVHASVEEMDKP